MRLLHLHVNGFGELRDLELELAEPGKPGGITLLLGPNEAGKSTIAAFLRGMLYGFPKRGGAAGRYEPAEGGVYGGRLAVEDDQGQEWRIERLERNGSVQTVIHRRGADGRLDRMTQSALETELLGGLNGELFRRLFAITLDELHELQALQGDEVGAFLYDTGLGGGRQVAEAERWLQQEADKLYKPRGRSQELAHTLQALDRVDRARREGQAQAARLADVEAWLAEADAGLDAAASARRSVREAQALTERAAHVSETWVRLVAAREALAGLPPLAAWPPDAAARWEANERRLAEAEAALGRAEEQRAAWERRLAALRPQGALLALAPEARRLARQADAVRHWQETAAETEAEAARLAAELRRLARQTDSGWTPERLLACDASFTQAEQARAAQAEADAVSRAHAQAADAAQRAAREADAAEAERREAERALARHTAAGVRGTGFAPTRAQAEEAVRRGQALQDALASRQALAPAQPTGRAGRAARAAGERRSPAAAGAYAFGGGALLLAALLGFAAGQWLAAGAVAAVGLAGTLAWAYASRSGHAGRVEGPADEGGAAERMAALQAEALRGLLGPLWPGAGGATALPDAAEQQALAQVLADTAEWAREQAQLANRARHAAEAAAAAGRRADALADEAEAALAAERGAAGRWRGWLRERGLPESLSPAGALEHLRRVEQALDMESQRERLLERASRLRRQIGEVEQECARLLQAAWGAAEGDGEAAAAAERPEAEETDSADALPNEAEGRRGFSSIGELYRLLERLEAEEKRQQEYERCVQQHEAALEACQAAARDAEDARKRKERLLAEAGVKEEAEFILRMNAEARRQEWERTLQESEAIVYRGGSPEQWAPLEELLTRYDGPELERRAAELQAELERWDARISEGEEQRGRLKEEHERLTAEVEGAAHHHEAAMNEAKLDEQASRYAVLALARTLIQRTRRLYEQEKQPEVLKRAAAHLRAMTEGRYVRVTAPYGTKRLEVERADGRLIDSSLLSRGTAEQLYLAMRFALAEALSHKAALPLILDDILVNYDRRRLGQAVQALHRLSSSHQIVMTTCHPHLAKAFRDEMEDVRIVELGPLG
ncbi:AAA family ATPase [Paenibacillus dendritiformis]|uniref:AAA family ATPase n=1 Tax=Paenibacillus dendritiformis TaxID=130049 RepID=UPI003668F476